MALPFLLLAPATPDTWWWHFGPAILQGGIQSVGVLLGLIATLRWYRTKQQQDRLDASIKHQNELQFELKKLREERSVTVKKEAFSNWIFEIHALQENIYNFKAQVGDFTKENQAIAMIQLLANSESHMAALRARGELIKLLHLRQDIMEGLIETMMMDDLEMTKQACHRILEASRPFHEEMELAIQMFRRELPADL